MRTSPFLLPGRFGRLAVACLALLAVDVASAQGERRRAPTPPPMIWNEWAPNLSVVGSDLRGLFGRLDEDRATDLILYDIARSAVRKGFDHFVLLSGNDRGRRAGGELAPELDLEVRGVEAAWVIAYLREPPRDGTRYSTARQVIQAVAAEYGFVPEIPRPPREAPRWLPRFPERDVEETAPVPRVDPATVQLRRMVGGVPRDRLLAGAWFDYERGHPDDAALLDAVRGRAAARGANEVWWTDDPALVQLHGGTRPQSFVLVFARAVPAQPGVSWELNLADDRGGPLVRRRVDSPAGVPEGLWPGDEVLRADGESIPNLARYVELADAWTPGRTVRFDVRRGGAEVAVDVVLQPPLP